MSDEKRITEINRLIAQLCGCRERIKGLIDIAARAHRDGLSNDADVKYNWWIRYLDLATEYRTIGKKLRELDPSTPEPKLPFPKELEDEARTRIVYEEQYPNVGSLN